MDTHTFRGHWGPFVICRFSSRPAACSLGLALWGGGREVWRGGRLFKRAER